MPEGFRSLATPVFRGSTTLFRRASAIVDTWNHDDVPYSYGSYGTPTTLELAARIAELEGGYRSFVTPGGQSALILTYMACLSAGDHVLVPESIYGPSRAFADQVLRRYGVEVEYYLPLEGPSLSKWIRDNTVQRFGINAPGLASRGTRLQLDWTPYGKTPPSGGIDLNLRLGLQLTAYDKLDGAGGSAASDANSVFLFAWLAF